MNKLLDSISKVKATIEAETYGIDPNVQVIVPELVSPIKVTIQTSALETGTRATTFDDVVKEISTLQLDLSMIPLSEVYEV